MAAIRSSREPLSNLSLLSNMAPPLPSAEGTPEVYFRLVLGSELLPRLTKLTRILGLSFWNNKEDAERYHQEQYPKIHEMMKHLLETEPNIRTFDVHTSTTHRIVAGKAA